MWIRGIIKDDMQFIGEKEHGGKSLLYWAKVLPSGTVAWACTASEGSSERSRIVTRGLIPSILISWLRRGINHNTKANDLLP